MISVNFYKISFMDNNITICTTCTNDEELVNLNRRLEKLSKDNNELRAKNDSYSKELKLALDELEQIIKDLGI